MSPVKLIKKEKPNEHEIQTEAVEPAADPKEWSKAVRSWVTEIQENRRVEPLPAFDSLFK